MKTGQRAGLWFGIEKYLFQVWIEFGRIKLPQGYHPNHVEEEWGKLIVEMLEREKSLRPAVERYIRKVVWHSLGLLWVLYFIMVFMFFRLELLLQIANKIQNGALNCEEKLTLAKNTLQAVSVVTCVPLFTQLLWQSKSSSVSCFLLVFSILVGESNRGFSPLFFFCHRMLHTWNQDSQCSVSQMSLCTFKSVRVSSGSCRWISRSYGMKSTTS